MGQELLFGIFKHFKGNVYFVNGVATHSETEEPMVVYRELEGEKRMFVRPLAMFQSEVEVDGKMVPRFQKQPMYVEGMAVDYPPLRISDIRGGH